MSSPRHPRVPGCKHWQALALLELPQMEPEEFLQYWDVSYPVLAKICFCSPRTVERWFSSSSFNKPTLFHKFCLSTVHEIWIRQ